MTKIMFARFVHVVLFLAAYGQAVILPTTGKSCPAGWTVSSNKCYFMDAITTRTWSACQSYCSAIGGRMPCIQSYEEKNFLMDRFALPNFWLGYNRLPGSYVWDAGSVGYCSASLTNWRSGEPSNGGEYCAQEYTSDGTWNDDDCNRPTGCVCETNQVVNDETCPVGWTVSSDNSRCYLFLNLMTSFDTCYNYCYYQGDSATMLCVQNYAENAFIWQKTTNKFTWMGLQRYNGAFHWNPGCSSSFTNFGVGEPNGGDGNSVNFQGNWGGQWDDVGPGSTANCACQINRIFSPTSKPTPAPVTVPTIRPTARPTCQPTSRPSSQPSRQPIGDPTSQPSRQPSSVPTQYSVPVSGMLDSSPFKVTNGFAFALITANGRVYAWGEAAPGGALPAPTELRLSSEVATLIPSRHAFTALNANGSVIPWGVPSHYTGTLPSASFVSGLVATEAAFAVVTTGGAVKAFGAYQNGGNVVDNAKCNGFSTQLSSGVRSLVATMASFTALKTDGTVYTWGNKYCGGGVSSETMTALQQVVQVVATTEAFAARLASGRVMTWGGTFFGGDSTAVASQLLADVLHLVGTKAVFAAFKQDTSLVVWGHAPYGGAPSAEVIARLAHGVSFIAHTFMALAALHTDGTVTAWGDVRSGGDASAVQAQLVGISTIVGNGYAFAALTGPGGVVAWGDPSCGGLIPADKVSTLAAEVLAVYHTHRAFAALKRDGSVVVWGQAGHGGSPGAAVEALLTFGVHTICSNDAAFSAIKIDGSVVGWGHPVSVPVPGVQFSALNLVQHVTCA